MSNVYTISCLLILICESYVIGEPIQNGDPLVNERAAFIAGIAVMKNGKIGNNICTGTLISPNRILTAATRCTEISEGEVLVAKFRNFAKNGPAIRVVPVTAKTYAEWYLEKNKKSATGKDSTNIAILMLSQGITDIWRARISPSYNGHEIGAKHTFIGWGFDAKWIPPPHPFKTALKVLSVKDCKEQTKKTLPGCAKFTWSDRLVCAATEPTVMLVKGDNRGPVFTEDKEVFGIFTRRAGIRDDCYYSPEQPNLILLLDDFKPFIDEMIQN